MRAKKPKAAVQQDCVMRCANCGHFKADTGECRRFPPAVLVAGETVFFAFPEPVPDEWCGEFARKDN